MAFVAAPTAADWYRAHNASIVAAYLEHCALAERENRAERFFINVVLLRVLYAHALVAAPRLALGRLRPFSRPLGDPRLGMAGIFLSLRRTVPATYPLPDPLEDYLRAEAGIGRTLDYVVIRPRLQRLYEWSAAELDAPGLRELIDDGAPVYAWPGSERGLFERPLRPAARIRGLPIEAGSETAERPLSSSAVPGTDYSSAAPGTDYSSAARAPGYSSAARAPGYSSAARGAGYSSAARGSGMHRSCWAVPANAGVAENRWRRKRGCC